MPEPLVMLYSRNLSVARATSGSTTWLHFVGGRAMSLPPCRILVTATIGHFLPSAASTPYACATPWGDTSSPPRMYCGAYLPMACPSDLCSPRRIIVSRTLQPPSCSTRAMKAVLVDLAVASMSEILPPPKGVSLRTFHGSPGPQLPRPPGHSLGV